MRKIEGADIWIGTGLLFLGIGFGGESLGLWPVETFLEGWWVLLMIIPCIINLIEKGPTRPNVIGLSLSLALLLAKWFEGFQPFGAAFVLMAAGSAFLFIPPPQEGE